MKTCLGLLSICVIFARTNEYCQNVAGHPLITDCEEPSQTGANVYVDLQKMNRSCTCIVKSFFTGDLLLLVSSGSQLHGCNEKLTAISRNKIVYFQCGDVYPISDTFSVKENDTADAVKVTTEYMAGFPSEMFHPCLHFTQNGGVGGTVSVTCANTSTTSITTSTTAAKAITSTVKPITEAPTLSTVFSGESSSGEISNEETNISSITQMTTAVLDSSQKVAPMVSDNITYVIAGAAASSVIVLVIVVIVVVIILRQKEKQKDNNPKTDEAPENTNRAFDESSGLPDNPLYHSNFAEPVDEVGYSTVQKEQLGLPPTDKANKRNRDPDYDVPPNNKPITDPDTSSIPIYAVPNKSAASSPEDNQVQGMYAQVSKPRKGSPQVPVQSANQDGLMYLDVVNNSNMVNQNTSPFTKNENKDGVTYAEIKRN